MQKGEYIKTGEEVLEYLPVRVSRSNKGTYGKVLCIAGSLHMAGAAYLCAWAAYRTGAGLVKILTPEENRVILQCLLPEALLMTFDTKEPDRSERQA
ncbi:MAG: bifunctional ADP-dependent NAD(P)H-hydrate dehydratase/NAD(P)H-hydrate epimerase, partial [Lachnospiraceae bacterium]|nr:bifunctional ADP-dependent NAD(P)H-hydrate dehydratase/NAD(P)H-hydrate epimerase [Lachnospiraceae bacterium]